MQLIKIQPYSESPRRAAGWGRGRQRESPSREGRFPGHRAHQPMPKGIQGSTTALLSTTAARGCPAVSLLLPNSCTSSCSPHTTGLGSGTRVEVRALFPRLGIESVVAASCAGQKMGLCCSAGSSLAEGRQSHKQSCTFPEIPALNCL